MAIQIIGNGGTIAEVDGTAHRAQRVATRPSEALGQYSWGGFTGILPAALAANSEIFQFRNPSANLVLVRRVKISASVSTTFFAAGVPVQIDLVKSTSWTVQGTGGSSPALAALLRKRTSMANTALTTGDIRIATTAALGAGTKTLETLAMGAIAAAGPITASLNGTIIGPNTVLFECDIANGDHPLTLAQFEGFSVRSVAVPATGTWMAQIGIEWMEMAAY